MPGLPAWSCRSLLAISKVLVLSAALGVRGARVVAAGIVREPTQLLPRTYMRHRSKNLISEFKKFSLGSTFFAACRVTPLLA